MFHGNELFLTVEVQRRRELAENAQKYRQVRAARESLGRSPRKRLGARLWSKIRKPGSVAGRASA